MKKIALTLFIGFVFLLFGAFFNAPAGAATLPEVVYLGEGPGTFTTPLDNFIVKLVPFDFDWVSGPTFKAANGQRVWGVRGANEKPPKLWHEEVNLGTVQAGCIASYVGVDDDLDGRINFFILDGQIIETVSEGMVFSGSFVIPRDGNLTFMANDSVAGWFDPCGSQVEPTATVTTVPTETATPGPSPTPTNTPLPTGTATPGPSPTATLPIPSPTIEPTATISTPTPTVKPTATKRPREQACLRINFEVGGDEARRGLYVVQEIGGRVLASWYAEDGWLDSGWITGIDITHENVYVQVLFYSGPDADPVEMKIVNHAPDSPYGWLSWGVCHALEVAWPDGEQNPAGGIDVTPQAPLAGEPFNPAAAAGQESPAANTAVPSATSASLRN